MHLLKILYDRYIKTRYGCWTNSSKIGDEKAEQLAQKIMNIGMSYAKYMELACIVSDEWARSKGWKYPYWSIISSDTVLDKVHRLVALENADSGDGSALLFNSELEYAIGIIAWVRGESDKPQRVVDVPSNVKIKVAEYICMLAGKECTTSNYISLAGMISD